MAEFLSLHDAVAHYAEDDVTVAIENVTLPAPFAADHEMIPQGKRYAMCIGVGRGESLR